MLIFLFIVPLQALQLLDNPNFKAVQTVLTPTAQPLINGDQAFTIPERTDYDNILVSIRGFDVNSGFDNFVLIMDPASIFHNNKIHLNVGYDV